MNILKITLIMIELAVQIAIPINQLLSMVTSVKPEQEVKMAVEVWLRYEKLLGCTEYVSGV